MANTTTRTFTEDGSGGATWTISVTGTDGFVTGDTFVVPYPSKITAKYVQASKTYCKVKIYATSSINGFMDSYRLFYRGKYVNGSVDDNTFVASTSGTTYTLTPVPESDSSNCWAQTLNTSTYWNNTNKTTRTIDVTILCHAHGGIRLATNTSSASAGGTSYSNGGSADSFSFVSTVTLDVPPQVELGTPTYSSQYAGVGTYTVPITTATAQYKGDISSVKLTVGTQIEEQTYSAETISNETISIVPSVAGEFTPTITVTDSRGQTTTVSLSKITVLPYNGPSISFDVYRTNSVGIKDDEGSYGLIKLTQDYISNAVNIIQPTVAIDETETNNVIWYSTYSENQGVSNIISDWSQVPSGVQIYGLINETFSLSESYKITVIAHDSYGKSSIAITQTMSTAYYTIDFKAGGKEITFGGPANDNLANYPNGLFKCEMDIGGRGFLNYIYPVGSYYETSDATFNPNTSWGGTWVLVTKDSVTFNSGNNITMPAATETKMCTINLDAGKRYLLIGTAGAGSAASAVSSSNIGVQSGTYNYFYNCGVNSATASAGRILPAMAYIETNTACVVYIAKYNYGSSAISTAWGHIVAIPLINLQDGNYKWHRTA